jgi:hypothetical protein
MMTSSTSGGRHFFNQTSTRTGEPRPRSEWVEMAVLAIVDEETSDRVQRTTFTEW